MADGGDQFWLLGRYAGYVLSAYGIAVIVVAANIVVPWLAHKRLLRRIRNEEFVDDQD